MMILALDILEDIRVPKIAIRHLVTFFILIAAQ